jgi:glycerol-3-phosphate dehydrogenase
MTASFSPETREATLGALTSADLDLLVVGGGITGAGVARDAALRGLRVALVERVDWAAGTSSRSSKLIHGGVRYLEQGDVGLVREAANERFVLRRIAPHLTAPLRLVMPTYSRTAHMKLGVGLWTFERLATVPPEERHEIWDREQALHAEPLLDGTRLHGAAVFTEYATDDARLVLDTVIGAHEAGALCVNRVEAAEFAGDEIALRDRLGGRAFGVRARAVVNAAGPWVDDVRRRAGALTGPRLHLTKGIHLVVPHARLPVRHIVVMQAKDRRAVFAVPRGSWTYLGTTDTDHGPPVEHPEVTADDADYLLEAANRTFTGPPLRRDEVVAAWAGLRPLLHEDGKRPSEISRKDEIMIGGGLISIAGGKLTTHRRMAERVVDLVVERLGRPAGPCRTDTVPLPNGAVETSGLAGLERALEGRVPQLGPDGVARLVRLYGGACARILRRAEADGEAAALLPGPTPVLRAEIDHVLDDEMALTLEDVLERRTRLLVFDGTQGLACADAVARIAAARLGWDDARTAAELEAYRALAAGLRSFA